MPKCARKAMNIIVKRWNQGEADLRQLARPVEPLPVTIDNSFDVILFG